MTHQSRIKNNSFWQKYQFYFLLLAALIIRQIPVVSLPLNWLESYFHEMSHGIAALVTGGQIISIQLFANGAGLCTTQGGISVIISFFGYAGATLWGWLIVNIAKSHQRTAQIFSAVMLCFLLLSILFWVRDLLTIIIVSSLAIMFFVTIKLQRLQYLQMLVKFFGLSILLNSLLSPTYLFDGRSLGDGAALATMTFIPEFIWVIIWCGLAIMALYQLMRANRKRSL